MDRPPEDIQIALDEYGTARREPGGFLMAVLEGDLFKAVRRADNKNLAQLGEIVCYVYNFLPYESFGSKEKVADWLAR